MTVAVEDSRMDWNALVLDMPETAHPCVLCDAPAVIRTHVGWRCRLCEPVWAASPAELRRMGPARVREALEAARARMAAGRDTPT